MTDTTHCTMLTLEELAVGAPGLESASQHVAGCDECRTRLDALKTDDARLQHEARYRMIQTRVLATGRARKPAGSWRRWLAWTPILLAAAAVVLWARPDDQVIAKGSYRLWIVQANTGEAIGEARVGEQVVLAVNAASAPYVVVLGVSVSGEVGKVWPPEGEGSGLVPAGNPSRLQPAFGVTAGSLQLIALFSKMPIVASRAVRLLQQSLASSGTAAVQCSAEHPLVPDQLGCAAATLSVKSQ